VRRGEVWTAGGGKDYAGKPRPVVIVQDDRLDASNSIMICAFTSDPTDAPLFRVAVAPSETNGLRTNSRLMTDKTTTVPKARLGKRLGRLADEDVVRLNRAVMIFSVWRGDPDHSSDRARTGRSAVTRDQPAG
jgi:mRNA interferase MazF